MRQYSREDINYADWYSNWMKQLALNNTRAELMQRLGNTESSLVKSVKSHLSAIDSTSSMQSNSNRRAKARQSVEADGETKIAINGALEIYELFPEYTKENI